MNRIAVDAENPERITVLLVDDNPAFRAVLGDVLYEEGCRVARTDDPADALAILDSLIPDLVILDLASRTGTGWELAGRLRLEPQLSNVPIVVFSAKDSGQPRRGLHVLRRPTDLSSLLGVLSAIDEAREAR